jgi:hypothetical protein
MPNRLTSHQAAAGDAAKTIAAAASDPDGSAKQIVELVATRR